MIALILTLPGGLTTASNGDLHKRVGTVIVNCLNIRKSPNVESDIQFLLMRDAAAWILEESVEEDGIWYYIKFTDSEGKDFISWAKGDYLTVEEVPIGNASPNCDVVNVRSDATTASEILMQLKAGDTVIAIKRIGGWYNVETEDSVRGWVREDLLDLEGSSASKPQNNAPAAANATFADRVVETAQKFIGYPYRWGGSSPNGFDCSGFTQYVFAQHGIYIDRTAAQQAYNGTFVPRDSLQKGDIVSFNTKGTGINHVGLYIGSGKFIHSANERLGVTIGTIYSDYYTNSYARSCRVISP